ncbi:MAG: hypothetical protein ACXWU2_02035 [Allosphingosinicella sp.]
MATTARIFPRAGYWFLALLALALIAFWPSYFSLLPFGPDRYAHFHAVAVVAWLLLLIAQPFLISRGRRRLHRGLGRISFGLVPLIVLTATLLAHARFAALDESRFREEGHSLYLPAIAVVLFLVCYALAMWHRRDMLLHARYMVATALPLIDPIVARLLGFYTPVPFGPMLYPFIGYAITDLVLAVLIWRDRGRPRARRAFLTLLPVFLLAHAGWFTLAQTGPWFAFAAWFRSLPLG